MLRGEPQKEGCCQDPPCYHCLLSLLRANCMPLAFSHLFFLFGSLLHWIRHAWRLPHILKLVYTERHTAHSRPCGRPCRYLAHGHEVLT